MNVTLWDVATGKPLGASKRVPGSACLDQRREGGTVWSRTAFRDPLDDWFSPDRSILLVNDNPTTARLRVIATGQAVGKPIPHQEPFVCAAFSRDGSRIVIGGCDRTARVYAAATGAPEGKPMTHEGWVTDVAFSPRRLDRS